jgi:hypothetical protein
MPRLLSALAALSVPPLGLAELQARLTAPAAEGPAPPISPGDKPGDEPLPLEPLPLEQLPLARLGLDSLGRMEFCIHLELDHGVPLTPDRLLAMGELGELLAFLADPPGPPS